MINARRLLWFILARVVVVSLFLISTIVLRVKGTEILSPQALNSITQLIVATYFFSILSLLFLKVSLRINRGLRYLQIGWDIFFITVLIVYSGGINSPFSFLYLLAITSSSFLLGRRDAFYTASLCAIVYGAIIDLQFYGKLSFLGLTPLVAQYLGTNYIFYTIFMNIVAFFLTAFLSGSLAERARQSETELEKRAVDYEELERLNSTIVANLNSGLLTTNNDGRIRVFNHYAELLVGMSQEEAYGRNLYDIFPGFRLFSADVLSIKRGEFEYIAKSGNKLVLGFNSVILTDSAGAKVGAMINFQDLTDYKRMEESLKKADRLAAVGELAARIAHEIRNPLAAVSGAVQLIAGGASIDANDKKLFDIILRETDRLNLLIRDFLGYARPTQPNVRLFNLAELLNEIRALVGTDSRFAAVNVENEVNTGLEVLIDPDQFRQVFWNLLVNAAEAMPAGGQVVIDATHVTEILPGERPKRAVKIIVSDNGSGMSAENVAQVFEPFFSTKGGGTGLGLATVYRIIEAHGGHIAVDSSPGKGTSFIIVLPEQQPAGQPPVDEVK